MKRKCFIPRRESARRLPRCPIVFTYIYSGLGNELEKKKGHPSIVILAELFPQNVLFDGTGWTGWTEYQKGPLFFSF